MLRPLGAPCMRKLLHYKEGFSMPTVLGRRDGHPRLWAALLAARLDDLAVYPACCSTLFLNVLPCSLCGMAPLRIEALLKTPCSCSSGSIVGFAVAHYIMDTLLFCYP